MTPHPRPLLLSDWVLRTLAPALGVAISIIGMGGCRSLLGDSQARAGAPEGLCSEPIGTTGLTLPEAPAVQPPRSRVSVDIAVARSRIEGELARQIPKELAAESGQPIGAPGRLSYRVTRGALDLGVENESVVLRTNVLVNAAVCKPLGPFCPVYGRCAPELIARGAVPLAVGEDYSLPRSDVSIVVTKPCVIAGYDATPRLQRIAQQQAQTIERQINRRLPRIRPQVEHAWNALRSPVALASKACLRVAPDRVIQSPPRLDSNDLGLRYAVLGELQLLRPCPEAEAQAEMPPLPNPEMDAELTPGVDLRVALVIGWDSVSEQLTQTLTQRSVGTGSVSGLALESVQARGVMLEKEPRVALALNREGSSCDHLVALAVPAYDAASKRLRLSELQLATPPRGSEARQEAEALLAGLRQRGEIALPEDLSDAPAALRDLERRLTREHPAEVAVDLSLDAPTVVRTVPASAGLVVVVGMAGHLAVRIE